MERTHTTTKDARDTMHMLSMLHIIPTPANGRAGNHQLRKVSSSEAGYISLTLQYKFILIGGRGVGKTAFLKRHLTGQFSSDYKPTLENESHLLKFNTNYGLVTLNVLDSVDDSCYAGTDAAIYMFDLTSPETYRQAENKVLQLLRVLPELPIIICGNKCDIKERKVKPRDITIHHHLETKVGRKFLYYDISSMSNYNFEKPFLSLLRQITGHSDLVFVAK